MKVQIRSQKSSFLNSIYFSLQEKKFLIALKTDYFQKKMKLELETEPKPELEPEPEPEPEHKHR